jgi:ABC-type phosphate transport system substrate-binding protein
MTNHILKKCLLAAVLGVVAQAAFGDVVVVVSAKSDVASLTSEQVSQIFLAKSSTFPGGAAAAAIDQDEGAAARNEFYTKVTGKDAAQLKAYWSQLLFSGKAQQPPHVADSAAVKKAVNDKAGGIGYIEKSAVDATVKVVLAP